MDDGISLALSAVVTSVAEFRNALASYTAENNHEVQLNKTICGSLNDMIGGVDTKLTDVALEVDEHDGRLDELETLTEQLKKKSDAGGAVLASFLNRICQLEKNAMDMNDKLIAHCKKIEDLLERVFELEHKLKVREPVLVGRPVGFITYLKSIFS